MKRGVIVAVLMGAIFIGYRVYNSTSGPVKRYESFANAILHRDYDAASGMTAGLSQKDLEREGTQEHIGAGPPMFQTLFPSKYQIEAKETSSDGTLTLHAVQTVLFNPAGVESATRPAMYAKMKQVVSMQKRGSEWKITAFENKFQEMDSLTSR